MNPKKRLHVWFSASLLIACSLGAHGESAGLNFVGMPAFFPQPLGSDTTAGWIPQKFWIDGSGNFGSATLHADDGGQFWIDYSGFQASWSAPSTQVSDTGGLMGTYLSGTDDPGSQVVIDVSGVPFKYTNAGYAVVVYYGSGLRTAGSTLPVTKATISGPTYGSNTLVGLSLNFSDSWKVLPQNSTMDAGNLTPDGNVMVFRGLKDDSFTLTVTGGVTNAYKVGVINGLQIVPMSSLPVLPPSVTSGLAATGTVGVTFGYQITAEGTPSSYAATGLPSGLSVDATTGHIGGTPMQSGTNLVQISAIYPDTTVSAVLTLTINPGAPAADYQLIDLGTLGGESYASGINALGQVVGTYKNAAGQWRAFLYSGSQSVDLGTLGGASSSAGGINDAGLIVGSAKLSSGQSVPFLWTNGTMIALPIGGTADASATCINNLGVIAGFSDPVNSKPYIYKDGAWNPLYQPASFSQAIPYGINSAGQMSGILRVGSSSYPYHAALWPAYPTSTTNVNDFGIPGLYSTATSFMDVNNDSIAFGINDAGHAVGYAAKSANFYSAFIYQNGGMQSLGVPVGSSGSFATGINNYDEVVGNFAMSGANYAFVWDSTRGMRNLNSLIASNSGWVLTKANAINDRGQIAGEGMVGGVRHAFLLTPRSERSIFVIQPVPQTIKSGSNIVLNPMFLGTDPVSYQWWFNGAKLDGATNSTLTLNSIQLEQDGTYTLVVVDANGEFDSTPVKITVQAPPTIQQQPSSLKLLEGSEASLVVKVTGSLPIHYQWQLGGTNLLDATNATLTIPSITSAQTGGYCVVITNDFGSVTSVVAQLDVIRPPKLSLGMYAGITLEGDPGQACRIEYVDALGDTNAWSTLTTIVLTNNTQFYLDMDSLNRPKRFYRTVLQP